MKPKAAGQPKLIARKDGTPSPKSKLRRAAVRPIPTLSNEAKEALTRARDSRLETASKAPTIRMG